MNPLTTSAFDLPDHLAAKADPALIAGDEQHFAAIAESLEQSIADLSDRLDAERRAPGGTGQEAMDRDLEIHRLTARLRTLRRFGLDLCLGRIVRADEPEPVYVGRLGLTDSTGRRLLVDWRSPAAEPFFGATHANPMGLASRRRYRWTRGRISDYWDEVFTPDGSRGARRARRPVRVHRQPGQQPVGRGCGTCSAPSRPTRTRSSAPGPAARSSSTAARAPARPSSPCTARRTSSTPTRGSATAAAACCSSARTSPTWPTSPTSCPASARRACRPAPCATSSPRAPAAAIEADPEVARLKSSADDGAGDRAGGPALRGAADRGHGGRDAVGRHLAQRRRLGRGVRRRRSPAPRTTRRRDQVWEELLTILVDKHDDEEVAARPAPPVAARRTSELRRRLQPGVAADRADRPGRRPVVGARVPAPVRALARARRGPAAAARGPAGLDGRPTCRSWTRPGSGSATRRRRGAGAGARRPSPPSGRRWRRSSTT